MLKECVGDNKIMLCTQFYDMVAVVAAWCSVVTVWTKVFCPWCSSHSHSAVEIPHDIQIVLFLDVADGVREFFEEEILIFI